MIYSWKRNTGYQGLARSAFLQNRAVSERVRVGQSGKMPLEY
jgi:hypothetical protein